jgi:hypothetical protein
MHKLSEISPYFIERYNATGRAGLTTLQKCTAALHQLAYGMTIDTIDEYLKLGKTTALECLKCYCLDIIECFGDEFLRLPTITDTQRLLAKTEEHGFPSIYVREHRLYALAVAQLSDRLAGPIYKGASNILPSSLKLLLLMTVESSMLFLESPVPTTTSVCLINLHCSLMS